MSNHFSGLKHMFAEPEEYLARGYCICCGQKITYFKDSKSRKEFEKSGLCQDCQDQKYGCSSQYETFRK